MKRTFFRQEEGDEVEAVEEASTEALAEAAGLA